MPFLLTIASLEVAICRFVISYSLRDTDTSTKLRYGLISINEALVNWFKVFTFLLQKYIIIVDICYRIYLICLYNMKILHLLPLIPLSTAYVIPSEEVLEDLNINKISNEKIHFTQKENIQNALDDTLDSFSTAKPKVGTDSRIDSWINRLKDYALDSLEDEDTDEQGYTKDDEDIIDSNLPFPLPHLPFSKHHHHDGNSDKTIYQLISSSKYTTNLTKIIDEDESLVHLLNNTNHNFTLFAPTDHAFAKLPPHLPELSKEFIRAVLHYHLAAGVYSALDVFHHQTLPTLLNETTSGHELPQRVTVRPGLKGLKVNFYGRLVAVDIVRLRPSPFFNKSDIGILTKTRPPQTA